MIMEKFTLKRFIMDLKEIKTRLKAETPDFFKKVKRVITVLSAAGIATGSALAAIPTQVQGLTGADYQNEKMVEIGTFIIVASSLVGVVGVFLSSLTVKKQEDNG